VICSCGLKLHHVVSDITGVTGMKIIRAILKGERGPGALAEFRDVRCKASVETICEALTGNYRAEHVFTLRQAVELYDSTKRRSATATWRSRPRWHH
jgi:transposase